MNIQLSPTQTIPSLVKKFRFAPLQSNARSPAIAAKIPIVIRYACVTLWVPSYKLIPKAGIMKIASPAKIKEKNLPIIL